MSFAIGIVGLPNVGKSTLFKALTKQPVDIANYPFATIDPNVGVVKVPDERLEKLARVSKSAEVIPTTIEFNDIAGLVAGASKGEGLGNKFLANIREVDAIAHVVRVFTQGDITHVSGEVKPLDDIETIRTELLLADLATIEKRVRTMEKEAKSGDKEAIKQFEYLKQIKETLEAGREASTVSPDESLVSFSRQLQLLTQKPVLYVFNADENATEDDLPEELRALPHVMLSAKIEAELVDLSDEEREEMMRELGLASSGLDRLILESYKLLDLITFFTSGEMETRAWTVKRGATAPQAAGRIHTDFETGFIRAEVVDWNDLVENGAWAGARERGKIRMEGKDYVVQDGDVVFFHHAN